MQRLRMSSDSFSTFKLSLRLPEFGSAFTLIQFPTRLRYRQWLDRGWHGGNVSKVCHAAIRRDGETGRFTIEDVSQFGTAVNGKPVGQNASAELPRRATISLAGVIDLQWEAV